ncbi:hypothetical protein CPB83DRAFT_882599 [Crepidotus variabilis]|uniref:Uncharacterized protein n=1 Tax=Crepidotus variabilis TaxID=179855 RepID=A0A9P6EHV9_9AGAR|nr:hypothetical protein CPB83DRAFT_882599 [Crepidotus variabilis]
MGWSNMVEYRCGCQTQLSFQLGLKPTCLFVHSYALLVQKSQSYLVGISVLRSLPATTTPTSTSQLTLPTRVGHATYGFTEAPYLELVQTIASKYKHRHDHAHKSSGLNIQPLRSPQVRIHAYTIYTLRLWPTTSSQSAPQPPTPLLIESYMLRLGLDSSSSSISAIKWPDLSSFIASSHWKNSNPATISILILLPSRIESVSLGLNSDERLGVVLVVLEVRDTLGESSVGDRFISPGSLTLNNFDLNFNFSYNYNLNRFPNIRGQRRPSFPAFLAIDLGPHHPSFAPLLFDIPRSVPGTTNANARIRFGIRTASSRIERSQVRDL